MLGRREIWTGWRWKILGRGIELLAWGKWGMGERNICRPMLEMEMVWDTKRFLIT